MRALAPGRRSSSRRLAGLSCKQAGFQRVSMKAVNELKFGNHRGHFCFILLVTANRKSNSDSSSWKIDSASCKEFVAMSNLSKKDMVEDTDGEHRGRSRD